MNKPKNTLAIAAIVLSVLAILVSVSSMTGYSITGLQTNGQDASGNIYYTGGDVGIGTDNPLGSLHIKGDEEVFKPGLILEKDTGKGPRILLLDSYNTGNINTAPVWGIDGNDDNFRIFAQPNITTGGTVLFMTDRIGNLAMGGWKTGVGFPFNLKANGDVGIGTNNPLDKLHLKGTMGIEPDLVKYPGDTPQIRLYATDTAGKNGQKGIPFSPVWTINNDAGNFRLLYGDSNNSNYVKVPFFINRQGDIEMGKWAEGVGFPVKIGHDDGGSLTLKKIKASDASDYVCIDNIGRLFSKQAAC